MVLFSGDDLSVLGAVDAHTLGEPLTPLTDLLLVTQYPVLGIDSHACKEEIDDRLDDHGLHLHVSRSHLATGSAEVDETLRAESGREYVGEHLPEARERECRP